MRDLWPWLVPVAVYLIYLAGRFRARTHQEIRARIERPCYVYEYPLIGGPDGSGYIGHGYSPDARERDHREKWWWRHVDPTRRKVTRYPNKAKAYQAEQAKIRAKRPKFNRAGNPDYVRPAPTRKAA